MISNLKQNSFSFGNFFLNWSLTPPGPSSRSDSYRMKQSGMERSLNYVKGSSTPLRLTNHIINRHSRAGGNLKAYGITIPNQVGNDDAIKVSDSLLDPQSRSDSYRMKQSEMERSIELDFSAPLHPIAIGSARNDELCGNATRKTPNATP